MGAVDEITDNELYIFYSSRYSQHRWDGMLVTHITLNTHTFGVHNLLGRQTLYDSGLEVL